MDLVRAFGDILERIRGHPVIHVEQESVTVAHMVEYCKRHLVQEDAPTSLCRLLDGVGSPDSSSHISLFLALLEMVRTRAVLLRQTATFGEIFVKKADAFGQVDFDEDSLNDDWL